jgi:hypothetical protein
MLMQKYQKCVTPEAARKIWAIVPKDGKAVIAD